MVGGPRCLKKKQCVVKISGKVIAGCKLCTGKGMNAMLCCAAMKGDSATRFCTLQLKPALWSWSVSALAEAAMPSLWLTIQSCSTFLGVMLSAKSTSNAPERKRLSMECWIAILPLCCKTKVIQWMADGIIYKRYR